VRRIQKIPFHIVLGSRAGLPVRADSVGIIAAITAHCSSSNSCRFSKIHLQEWPGDVST
jgi:hypothetical protein